MKQLSSQNDVATRPAAASPQATTRRRFEIVEAHRERPGWTQLWERLFRPLPDASSDDPVESDA